MADWTRRHSIATVSRYGRSCKDTWPGNPQTCWRLAAAPANTRSRQSPDITWWPSDFNGRHLASIAAWRAHAGPSNLRPPFKLDLTDPAWCEEMRNGGGPTALLAVFCANVIHIAPWRLTEGLFAGAARYLRSDGLLLLYGPFKRDGIALSNAVFDASLRESDPEWGMRDTADLEKLGHGNGLALREVVEMPDNNLILVFSRSNRK